MPGITHEDMLGLMAVTAESMPEPLKRLCDIYEQEGDSERFENCVAALLDSMES